MILEEFIWKIKHKPTGLFYCSVKGRWEDTKTNLSNKGNFYTSEAVVKKVLKDIKNGADINKAQVERYNLDIVDAFRHSYSKALNKDFEIIKYRIVEEV